MMDQITTGNKQVQNERGNLIEREGQLRNRHDENLRLQQELDNQKKWNRRGKIALGVGGATLAILGGYAAPSLVFNNTWNPTKWGKKGHRPTAPSI